MAMLTLLIVLGLVLQVATLAMVERLSARLARLTSALEGRTPARRPPGPAATAAAMPCRHPEQFRVDASVLGRSQFLCLACDATVPSPKE